MTDPSSLPSPIEICLEQLDAEGGSVFTRCVAIAGRLPGLAVSRGGEILWKTHGETAFELWVTRDARLALFRPEGAVPVTVRRAERVLDAPCEKPVVMLDGDSIEAGGCHWRLHVHGLASEVRPPERLAVPPRTVNAARFAAAMALASAGGLASTAVSAASTGSETAADDALARRTRNRPARDAGAPTDASASTDANAPTDAGVPTPPQPPIELRMQPPAPVAPRPPPPPPSPSRRP